MPSRCCQCIAVQIFRTSNFDCFLSLWGAESRTRQGGLQEGGGGGNAFCGNPRASREASLLLRQALARQRPASLCPAVAAMSLPNKNERKRLVRASCPEVAAKRAVYEAKVGAERVASLQEQLCLAAAPGGKGGEKGKGSEKGGEKGKGGEKSKGSERAARKARAQRSTRAARRARASASSRPSCCLREDSSRAAAAAAKEDRSGSARGGRGAPRVRGALRRGGHAGHSLSRASRGDRPRHGDRRLMRLPAARAAARGFSQRQRLAFAPHRWRRRQPVACRLA